MKIIIINGSPRRKGDTVSLINEAKKYLLGEIDEINTYFTDVTPCNDCRYCWEHPRCVIDDDMQTVYKQIDEADIIIIASPLYFSELSGSLLQFASRLQYYYVSKYIRQESVLQKKKRQGIVLLTGGGDGSVEPALSTAKCLLKHMGAEFVDCVCSHNTNTVPASKDTVALNKIGAIVSAIAKG
ncbi:MAG: flavodoxin family protein [Oscillospiraceae bacterium]|nr:flavodoxin family protein [Oscillospiraceae bacterium]